jgi:hypothetical protein
MADEAPYFSVSKSSLHRTGTNLTDIADAVRGGANFPQSHGAEPYKDVTSALKEFKEDWGKEVRNLERLTRGAGAKATAAAKIMSDHDSGLAQTIGGATTDA